MNKSRFECFRAADGFWYFRVKAGNGKIVAQSEGYHRKAGCLNGIKAVCAAAKAARVIEVEN